MRSTKTELLARRKPNGRKSPQPPAKPEGERITTDRLTEVMHIFCETDHGKGLPANVTMDIFLALEDYKRMRSAHSALVEENETLREETEAGSNSLSAMFEEIKDKTEALVEIKRKSQRMVLGSVGDEIRLIATNALEEEKE